MKQTPPRTARRPRGSASAEDGQLGRGGAGSRLQAASPSSKSSGGSHCRSSTHTCAAARYARAARRTDAADPAPLTAIVLSEPAAPPGTGPAPAACSDTRSPYAARASRDQPAAGQRQPVHRVHDRGGVRQVVEDRSAPALRSSPTLSRPVATARHRAPPVRAAPRRGRNRRCRRWCARRTGCRTCRAARLRVIISLGALRVTPATRTRRSPCRRTARGRTREPSRSRSA